VFKPVDCPPDCKTPDSNLVAGRQNSQISVATIPLLALLLIGCGGSDEAGQDSAPASIMRTQTAANERIPKRERFVSVDGEFTGSVNGAKRTWYVTHIKNGEENESASFWMDTAGRSVSVSMIGHTTHTTRLQGKGELRISFIVPKIETGVSAYTPELSYYPAGLNSDWSSQNQGSAAVVLTSIEATDDTLSMTGTFSGVVNVVDEKAADLPPHMQKFTIEDGQFNVRLPNRK